MIEKDDRKVAEFEERLRRWGSREPTLPPQTAAARVLSALPARTSPGPWLRLAAAGAMLVLIAVSVWRSGRPHRAVMPSPIAAASDRGVVQFWLDSGTAVTFVLEPFGDEKGESS